VGSPGGFRTRRVGARIALIAAVVSTGLVAVAGPASSAPATFTGVAAGAAHSCAIRTGTVWCWGLNDSGQLGTETATDVAGSPVQVDGITDATAIAAGGDHTCALLSGGGGTVQCWGANNLGQLGNGKTKDSTAPVTVKLPGGSTLSGVTGITAGRAHTCAMNASKVWCWGANGFGQLGTADGLDLSIDDCALYNALPFCTTHASTKVATDGDGATYLASLLPAGSQLRVFELDPAGEYVRSIDAGASSIQGDDDKATVAVAVHGDSQTGRVYVGVGWAGDKGTIHRFDQATELSSFSADPDLCPAQFGCKLLGLATDPDGNVYAALDVTQLKALNLTTASFEVTKLDQSGSLEWRMDDTSGEFGGPNNPIRDLATGTDGQGHQLLYVLDGTMAAGKEAFVHVFDTNGAFLRRITVGDPSGDCVVPGVDPSTVQPTGIGTTVDGTVAVTLEQGFIDPHLNVGGAGTVFNLNCTELRSPAGAFMGSFGGVPDLTPSPGLVEDAAGTPDGELIVARALTGGVRKLFPDGTRDRSWGRQQFSSSALELRALGDFTGHDVVDAVGAGARHSCAIVGSPNRSAWCWGSNSADQLGLTGGATSMVSTSFPVKPNLPNPANFGTVDDQLPDALAAGADHTCLVRYQVQHAAFCFGDNGEGQLRSAAGTPGPSDFCPGASDCDYSLIAAGANFTCLARTGDANCKGDDSDGQLGNGADVCANNTARVVITESCPANNGDSVLHGITAVAGGNAHACAIADDGASVSCWGLNDDHQVSTLDDTAFDHAVDVLFPAPPGGGGSVIIGLVGPTGTDQVPLNGPMVVTFSPAVTNVDPANLLIGPQGGTPISGSMQCYDPGDQLLAGGCASGLVQTVVFTPDDHLTPGVQYEATVNPPAAPLVLVGGDPVAPTTVGFVHVHLGPAVPLTLAVGPVGTATYPNGLFVVGYSGNALAGVTTTNTIVTVHGSTTPIAGTSTCLDQSSQPVSCTTGPVASVQILPDDPIDPGAEFDAFLNPFGPPPATLSGEAVPPATAGPVTLPEGAPVSLTLTGANDATITAPDGPFVVHFSDPLTAVGSGNVVVTPEGSSTPLPGNQVCSNGADEVPCASGPVTSLEFAPDDTLPGGSTYTATLNPTGATPALRDGFRAPEATSNPLPVEDAAVSLTLSGPGGATTLTLHGPLVVAFSKVITGVLPGNLVVDAQGSATQVTGSIDCRDAADATVDCATGSVSSAVITPDAPLVPGETYAATLNPPGSTPATFDHIDIPQAASNAVQVGVGPPVSMTLSGPNGAPEVPLEGPFVLTLSTPLTELTPANVLVTEAGASGPLAGSMACEDASHASVDCLVGPVTTVEITPDTLLIPGTLFSASLDPNGAPPALEDGYPTPAAEAGPIHALTNLDQSSPAVGYTWGSVVNEHAVGGRYVAEDQRFARATFSFTGHRVQLFTVDGPDRGRALVRIDGVLVDQIDGSNPTVQFGVVHNYGDLVEGPHTISVTSPSSKGATISVGRLVTVDAFRVFSATGITLVDNPRMEYQWGRRPSGKATFGAYAISRRVGASASITFRGTGITWLTLVGPHMGGARVFVDGDLVGTFDNRAAQKATKRRVFGGLADGLHTLRIAVGGGGIVAVDGFLVKGSR